MKKRKIYYYFVLLPVEGIYSFSYDDKPEMYINFQKENTKFYLEFFMRPEDKKRISHYRLVFELPEGVFLGQKEFELVQDVKEYILALLRIIYSPFTMLHPFAPSFEEGVKVQITFPSVFNDPNFTLDYLRVGVVHGMPFKEDLILLSDSYNRYLSSIYKYLSVFKIFEKKGGEKETLGLIKKYGEQYQKEFVSLGISKMKLENFAWDLRAKCAHIVANKKGNGLRVNLNEDVILIESFLSIFQKMSIDLLNDTMKKESEVDFRLNWKHAPKWESFPPKRNESGS